MIREDWKELRPRIGNFISQLDSLYEGAENMDEALAKAETRGYNRGYKEEKKQMCAKCTEHDFYKACNGYITPIRKWMALTNDTKITVGRLIDQLYKSEVKNGQSDL